MFAGRLREIDKVKTWLRRRRAIERKVAVISIEGPGGIGKTMLLNQAWNAVRQTGEYSNQSYLVIMTDGRGDIHSPADWMRRVARSGGKNFDRKWQATFKRTARVIEHVEALTNATHREVDKQELSPEQKDAAKTILRGGLALLRKMPRLKHLTPHLSEEDHEHLVQALARARAMNTSGLGRIFPGRNAVRRDPDGELARAFKEDLKKILGTNAKKRADHLRLLWVIDDYEALPTVTRNFFVETLVAELDAADSSDFESTIVLLGRDRLWDTHQAWSRQFRHVHDGTVLQLEPFSMEEVRALCEAEGLCDEATVRRIYKESSGYPLLVDWAVREVGHESGVVRAPALQSFYDRITQWMSGNERDWFDKVVFLPRINLSTLHIVFPDGDETSRRRVLDWFKREASIRESDSGGWTVKPYVQDRVLKLFSIDDPEGCKDLLQRTGFQWKDPFAD